MVNDVSEKKYTVVVKIDGEEYRSGKLTPDMTQKFLDVYTNVSNSDRACMQFYLVDNKDKTVYFNAYALQRAVMFVERY